MWTPCGSIGAISLISIRSTHLPYNTWVHNFPSDSEGSCALNNVAGATFRVKYISWQKALPLRQTLLHGQRKKEKSSTWPLKRTGNSYSQSLGAAQLSHNCELKLADG